MWNGGEADSDANKRLVERFYDEVWARGNVEFAAEVFADNYVVMISGPRGRRRALRDRHRSRRRSEGHFQTCSGGSTFFSRRAISSPCGGLPRARTAGCGLELRRPDGTPNSRG
jgi:hypothetical protein